MHTKTLISMAGAAVLAGGLATAACASAASSGAATARTSGSSHIIIYSINSDGPDFKAIVTGAIGDYGPGVTVHPDGSVDPEHTSELELNLSHGSFRLSIATIDKDVIKAYSHWPSNKATCSGHIQFTASAPVVLNSGSGLYRGITGSYALTVQIDEVDVKPVCNGTSPFISQVILMDGTGTVSY
jgi:hypothetical protein